MREATTDAPAIASLVVAAALDRPGTWGWSLATSDTVKSGVITAGSAGADKQIAAAVGDLTPAPAHIAVWGYRPYVRQNRSLTFSDRPYTTRTAFGEHFPACRALSDPRTLDAARAAGIEKAVGIDMRRRAAKALPVIPVHPGTPTEPLTGEAAQFGPWTVACDGSVQRERVSWSFITGAGYADCDRLPIADSNVAEFAAYGRALAIYPDGAAITLITDSQQASAVLEQTTDTRQGGGLRAARLKKPRLLQTLPEPIFSSTLHHARRLRLTVEWRPRNTHPLQAMAHDLCNRA
jgi:hypothetical protein